MKTASVTLEHASKVYRSHVDPLCVARYYLKSEMPNILSSQAGKTIINAVSVSLDKLSEIQTWRLLEALSYAFRLNGVFSTVTDQAYDWYEVELPVECIALTGTEPHINKLVFSSVIGRNPLKFAKYLNGYFARHPQTEDDPEGLNGFRAESHETQFTTLLTHESKGSIKILDGTHRLLSMARRGTTSIRAYAAVKNGRQSKAMIGDSTFLTMRLLFEKCKEPEQREAIMNVTEMLVRNGRDGKLAIQSYWIDYPRATTVRDAGKRLMDA